VLTLHNFKHEKLIKHVCWEQYNARLVYAIGHTPHPWTRVVYTKTLRNIEK
jgi:hypothetical protein